MRLQSYKDVPVPRKINAACIDRELRALRRWRSKTRYLGDPTCLTGCSKSSIQTQTSVRSLWITSSKNSNSKASVSPTAIHLHPRCHLIMWTPLYQDAASHRQRTSHFQWGHAPIRRYRWSSMIHVPICRHTRLRFLPLIFHDHHVPSWSTQSITSSWRRTMLSYLSNTSYSRWYRTHYTPRPTAQHPLCRHVLPTHEISVHKRHFTAPRDAPPYPLRYTCMAAWLSYGLRPWCTYAPWLRRDACPDVHSSGAHGAYLGSQWTVEKRQCVGDIWSWALGCLGSGIALCSRCCMPWVPGRAQLFPALR